MDEREKAQLNKQKKLVDCIENLNHVLGAFENLEEYSSQLLSVVDGFDLTHSDTYLELTQDVRRELFAIAFFTQSAARGLAEYRALCHLGQKIYSVKERKIRARFNSQSNSSSSISQPNKTQSRANSDRLLVCDRAQQGFELQEIQDKLEQASQVKLEQKQRRSKRVEKIELRLLRLEWAILFLFLFQAAILVKVCQL